MFNYQSSIVEHYITLEKEVGWRICFPLSAFVKIETFSIENTDDEIIENIKELTLSKNGYNCCVRVKCSIEKFNNTIRNLKNGLWI